MRIKSRLLLYGPVPPPAGEERRRFLLERGTKSARAAGTAFLQAAIEATGALRESALPYTPDPFTPAAHEAIRHRMRQWRQLGERLREMEVGHEESPGETAARLALERAVAANLDLAETGKARWAHLQMHRIGEYVSGLYGCWHEYDDGVWFEICPVRLAHIPLGSSPGFTARRLCSICGDDVSECEHMPGRSYPLVASPDASGTCNLCRKASCEHEAGTVYATFQHAVLADATLLETSLTSTPREPLARITAVELDPQPPPPTDQAARNRCLSCMLPCPNRDVFLS